MKKPPLQYTMHYRVLRAQHTLYWVEGSATTPLHYSLLRTLAIAQHAQWMPERTTVDFLSEAIAYC
jgi:hypothetical protein